MYARGHYTLLLFHSFLWTPQRETPHREVTGSEMDDVSRPEVGEVRIL